MSVHASDPYLVSEYTPTIEYEQKTPEQILSSPVDSSPVEVLSVKPYPIPKFTALIPFLGVTSGWVGRPATITWDPAKTTISSSRLVIKVKSNGDPVTLSVKFNGTPVREFFWGEGTKGTEHSDVIGIPVSNGTNLLEVRAEKQYPWIAIVGVDVDAYVEVTFEGETPDRPWWETFQEWLAINWPYIAVATGVVIVGGATYVYMASPRGK